MYEFTSSLLINNKCNEILNIINQLFSKIFKLFYKIS